METKILEAFSFSFRDESVCLQITELIIWSVPLLQCHG